MRAAPLSRSAAVPDRPCLCLESKRVGGQPPAADFVLKGSVLPALQHMTSTSTRLVLVDVVHISHISGPTWLIILVVVTDVIRLRPSVRLCSLNPPLLGAALRACQVYLSAACG